MLPVRLGGAHHYQMAGRLERTAFLRHKEFGKQTRVLGISWPLILYSNAGMVLFGENHADLE